MSVEQAVITTFVSDVEWDVADVEDRLIEAIEKAGVGEFDGNVMGPGEVVLYAYGPDADALFDVMAPILRAIPAREAFAIKRYGEAGDPRAHEERVDLVPT
ncbi:MAG TPA: hypothetical protein VFB57_06210 [Gaiellaceae bacterium]|nr:hypothetical protein [Gaiellaceae bacterium]